MSDFHIYCSIWSPVLFLHLLWVIVACVECVKAKREMNRTVEEKEKRLCVEKLHELHEARMRIANDLSEKDAEIAKLEDEIEPEKKPAYRSIREGS